jgi:hypothetical protein
VPRRTMRDDAMSDFNHVAVSRAERMLRHVGHPALGTRNGLRSPEAFSLAGQMFSARRALALIDFARGSSN